MLEQLAPGMVPLSQLHDPAAGGGVAAHQPQLRRQQQQQLHHSQHLRQLTAAGQRRLQEQLAQLALEQLESTPDALMLGPAPTPLAMMLRAQQREMGAAGASADLVLLLRPGGAGMAGQAATAAATAAAGQTPTAAALAALLPAGAGEGQPAAQEAAALEELLQHGGLFSVEDLLGSLPPSPALQRFCAAVASPLPRPGGAATPQGQQLPMPIPSLLSLGRSPAPLFAALSAAAAAPPGTAGDALLCNRLLSPPGRSGLPTPARESEQQQAQKGQPPQQQLEQPISLQLSPALAALLTSTAVAAGRSPVVAAQGGLLWQGMVSPTAAKLVDDWLK